MDKKYSQLQIIGDKTVKKEEAMEPKKTKMISNG